MASEIVLFFGNLLISSLGAFCVVIWGGRMGVLDLPSQRSSHLIPVPKGGGVGILFGFILTSLWLGIPPAIWVPGAFLSLVSFLGDRVEISPLVRLCIQFCCALAFISGFGYLFGGWRVLFVIPILVFIVGSSNFYNFMDGIDGMAGLMGSVVFFLLAIYGGQANFSPNYIILFEALSAACLGFLVFNFPRARVFMGDGGSILLGFLFGGFVFVFGRNLHEFLCLVSFLFMFYVDCLTTLCVRVANGESLTQPHRRHLYQLLVNEHGIDHWKVSIGFSGIQLVWGLIAIGIRHDSKLQICFLVGGLILFSVASCWIRFSAKELSNVQ